MYVNMNILHRPQLTRLTKERGEKLQLLETETVLIKIQVSGTEFQYLEGCFGNIKTNVQKQIRALRVLTGFLCASVQRVPL